MGLLSWLLMMIVDSWQQHTSQNQVKLWGTSCHWVLFPRVDTGNWGMSCNHRFIQQTYTGIVS